MISRTLDLPYYRILLLRFITYSTLKTLALFCDIDSHQKLEPNSTLSSDKDRHQESSETINNIQTIPSMNTHLIKRTSLLQTHKQSIESINHIKIKTLCKPSSSLGS